MQQTPIEKALKDLDNIIEKRRLLFENIFDIVTCKEVLQSLLSYEKQYLRDVAEKAWDASEAHLGQMFLSSLKLNHPDKQTYLNQKTPTMKEELKQAIEKLGWNGTVSKEAIYAALSDSSILRHCDPEIMKAAGWVREEEWISVEDRLPKLPPPYKEDGVLITPFSARCIVFDGEYVFEESYDNEGFDNESITHWKTLPQPPKQ